MQKIKDFLKNHQDKLILTIGAILIASCSFAAGRISIHKQEIPIIMNENSQQQEQAKKTEQLPQNINTQNIPTQKQENTNATNTANTKTTKQKNNQTEKKAPEKTNNDCEFVASSRGHKYYKANSSSAKSLSEKNKICFPDEKAAEKAGYEPSASLSK